VPRRSYSNPVELHKEDRRSSNPRNLSCCHRREAHTAGHPDSRAMDMRHSCRPTTKGTNRPAPTNLPTANPSPNPTPNPSQIPSPSPNHSPSSHASPTRSRASRSHASRNHSSQIRSNQILGWQNHLSRSIRRAWLQTSASCRPLSLCYEARLSPALGKNRELRQRSASCCRQLHCERRTGVLHH